MKKSLLYTYGILIILTFTTALVSTSVAVSTLAVNIIMVISALKFIVVAFQFMELKKANSFWKITLIVLLILIVLVTVIII